MSVPPSVSVVIPVFNQSGILPITLPATTSLEGAREILFVDDGSIDASRSLLAQAARSADNVRVVEHPGNRGRAAARNTGMLETTGEVILFLDADILPERDLVTHHAKRFLDPQVIGVLSNDLPDTLDPRDPFHDYLLNSAGPRNVGPDEPLHFRYFIAGYSSVRRSALDEVGGFDQHIEYGEDLDLAYRLWQRWPDGLRLEPGAVVHQRCIGDLDDRAERLRLFGRNLPRLLAKHRGLASEAGLLAVSSPARRLVLGRSTGRLARHVLAVTPRAVRPHLIRYILASAVADGYRDGRA